ncbi:Ger(x)C family spore germination protein [Bacillus cereus]|uniref:Ger(x)C family spore germination protein n=1 Tax=Bacillus cereus TaxID=1396 RepID=UPI0030129F82
MFKIKLIHYLLILFFVLTGCSDQRHLEEMSLSLILGLDLDTHNNLQVYVSSPVFAKEAKIKEETTHVQSFTLRNSREKLDEQTLGMMTGGKTQLILIGKRLLNKKGWIHYLDTFYRDPKNSMTARMIAVDGSVADVFHYAPKNKPRLPLYLTKLMDTAYKRNNTVLTNLQDLRNQILEKGITPSITRMKKSSSLQIGGSVLLNNDQQKRMTITPTETKLLRILQKRFKGEFPFFCSLSSKSGKTSLNRVSFSIQSSDVQTDVKYNKGFHFEVNIPMRIIITEFSPQFLMSKTIPSLEKELEKEMTAQFQGFIKSIQSHQIDPVGYGLYSRAYTYHNWKTVSNNWGKEFSQSKIRVRTHVKIMGTGTVK